MDANQDEDKRLPFFEIKRANALTEPEADHDKDEEFENNKSNNATMNFNL